MKAALYERGHHGLPGRGTWYLLTSGMTGYLPNQSEAAVSERIEGPYTPVGGPHPADAAITSWHSQISQVFAAADGTLLSIADRWVPRRQLDQKEQEILIRTVASAQEPERYSVTEEERAFAMSIPEMDDTKADTGIADCIWLPVELKDGLPVIPWREHWHI